MKILLATHNINKYKEIRNILKKKKIYTRYLDKVYKIAPKEYGNTFRKNAQIKAIAASNLTNWKMDCLADDSGLCIEALNGAPGIHSSSWAPNNDYEKAFAKIKKRFELLGTSMNGKKAKFVCSLVFLKRNKEKFFYEGFINGYLTYPPKGFSGFGYDSIFLPVGSSKTLAELGEKKNIFSHRRLAIDNFLKAQHY